MVQLVSQRRQRPATGPADHDLPHQVTSQRLGQHAARHSQHLGRRLPRAGDGGIIQDSQLLRYPRLQRLQQRRLPGQRPRLPPASRKTSLTTIASRPARSPPDGSSSVAVDSIAAVAAWRSARS